MIWTGEIFYLNNKYTLSDSDNQISSEISSFRQMIQEILLLSTFTSFFSYLRSLFCLGDNDDHFCPSLFSEKVFRPCRTTLPTYSPSSSKWWTLTSTMKQWPLIGSSSRLPPPSPVYTWCWVTFDSSRPFLSTTTATTTALRLLSNQFC